MDSEALRDSSENGPARANRCVVWIRANPTLFLMVLLVVLIALVPLYGVLFPPLVDLPEHILMSKLLWEKLSGVSHLDLEISYYLGYRLFPALMTMVIYLCKLGGISFVYLPKIAAMILISLHAIVISVILYFGLKDKSWSSCALAVCFSVPAVVCMYSACWFIGFVNYTLAITVLILAIFLTDRFLRSGKPIDASWLFLALLMVYIAHPFALTFWLLWCLGRALATVAMRSFLLEWKRLILLGVLFSPIFLYHYWATAGTPLALSGHPLMSQSPFVSINDWYHYRLPGLLNGVFLRADDAADSRLFGLVALGLILFAAVVAFCSAQNRHVKTVMFSTVFLFVISSWIDEKFFPVPIGFWLAYDYRYSSTVYAICLALSGMVLVRLLPVAIDKARGRIIFAPLAFLSIFASLDHVVKVREAYARFDVQARKYMAKVFDRVEPVGIGLPHSLYHPDGSFLKQYICLRQSDSIPPGSTFAIFSNSGLSGNLYPVKVRLVGSSQAARMTQSGGDSLMPFPSSLLVPFLSRALDDGLVGYWKLDEASASDACVDSSGHGNLGAPYGTAVVDGKVNRARSFNGVDYINIPTISTPDAITVAAWVYSDNFAQNGFVVTKNPVNTQWALFFESNGFIKWRGSGFMESIACPVPSNTAWHHIVAKQKGSAGGLYVDGHLCASGTLPAIGNASNSINIGRYDTVSFDYFHGRIDEVRIYNRALSDSEIARLFTAGDSKSPPSPSPKMQLKE
jgi:Concanavalin A-like lectin/glucanases superfamily